MWISFITICVYLFKTVLDILDGFRRLKLSKTSFRQVLDSVLSKTSFGLSKTQPCIRYKLYISLADHKYSEMVENKIVVRLFRITLFALHETKCKCEFFNCAFEQCFSFKLNYRHSQKYMFTVKLKKPLIA